jgi:hypothetical protein
MSEPGEQIQVTVAGVRVRFRTTFPALAAYARAHLAPLLTADDGDAEISSDLIWIEGLPPHDSGAVFPSEGELDRIDRDLYRGQTSLAWPRIDDFRDLKLRFLIDGDRLSITGHYYFHLSNHTRRDAVKRLVYWRRLPGERRRAFTTLLYYLIYYPCLWWLETRRAIHPLHGGAVAMPGGGVLLAGLGAVGKSTLTVALAGAEDTRFLSDTFVLYDRARLYPMKEPILLDAWSRKWLGPAGASLHEVASPYNYGYRRRGFHIDPGRCAESAPLGLALFPHRAARSALRELSLEDAVARITASNEISKDLRRYWTFAAVLNLLEGGRLSAERRRTDLARLLRDVPSYEIGLANTVRRDEIVERVRSLLAPTEPLSIGSP